MNSTIFYIALFVHLVSLITGFGSVLVIDSFGLAWLLKLFGVTLDLVKKVANITQRLIWIGYSGMIASGLVLITQKGFVDNLTKIKLFFVIMVGINGVFLHLIKKSMEKIEREEDLTPKIFSNIFLASFISQLGWWGAFVIGFLHRHWRHEINSPENPWLYMVGLVILVLLVAGFAKLTLVRLGLARRFIK